VEFRNTSFEILPIKLRGKEARQCHLCPEDSYGAYKESVRSNGSFILPALRVKASATYRTGVRGLKTRLGHSCQLTL